MENQPLYEDSVLTYDAEKMLKNQDPWTKSNFLALLTHKFRMLLVSVGQYDQQNTRIPLQTLTVVVVTE